MSTGEIGENFLLVKFLLVYPGLIHLLLTCLDPAGLFPWLLKYAVRSTLRWSGVQSARREGETPPL